jgi:hypothetical protein
MTTRFEAPIERVFDLGTDFARFPEWNISYSEVKKGDRPPHEVGTTARSRIGFSWSERAIERDVRHPFENLSVDGGAGCNARTAGADLAGGGHDHP